jgi:hypothetical protein
MQSNPVRANEENTFSYITYREAYLALLPVFEKAAQCGL